MSVTNVGRAVWRRLAGTEALQLDELSRALHAAAGMPGMVAARAFIACLGLACEARRAEVVTDWEPGVVLYDWSPELRELNASLYEGLALTVLVESGFEPRPLLVLDFAGRLAIPADALPWARRNPAVAHALFPARLLRTRATGVSGSDSGLFPSR